MTREHLEREYQKARAAMIQRNEYLKRLLNVEEPNSIKVTNKKQKKDNIQDVSHINSKQRPAAPQSDDILPAILSPPHIQNAGYSTSGRTYTQSYLAAGEETLESFDVVLAAELEQIKDSQPSVSDWQKRRKNAEINWGESRAMLFDWTLSELGVPDKGKICVQCTNCEASIKCEDCFAFLCHICDQMQHFLMPFHHRLYWKNGFYEPLDPTQTVCPEGNIFHWKPVVPAQPPNSCPNCTDCKFKISSSSNLCIFITIMGRYDLYTPIYTCHCGYEHQQLGKTMHKSGFYSSLGKSSTFYSTSLLESWHHIKRNCPGTSFRALVTALESFGASRGRIGPINYITSKRVFFEWRFQQYELRKIRGEADNECPACDKTPLAVHIDGNKKLYRYNKVGRGIRNPYYSDSIFSKDEDVQAHVGTIQSLKTKSKHTCGVSTWKAAQNKPLSFQSLDETGISMASCRHGIILHTLNMYQGELYSYAHYLQIMYFKYVKFICQDIICKYWPWALTVAQKQSHFHIGQAKPFLGVLHAKGHAWYCQVNKNITLHLCILIKFNVMYTLH
ncbi:uncharacterized protein [Procambarus clarkii]|uniref:uncharacterized protein isoform X1 n=1 Tax=Procambarus clarkii TaxID=6728 RepID=UPI0037429B8F